MQPRGRYGGGEGRGGRGYDPDVDDDDELESWEDGGETTTRSTLMNGGAWTAGHHPGPHRLMAALGAAGGVSTPGGGSAPRTMLHNLLAMTTGADHLHRTFPPLSGSSVSPSIKSPTRPPSSSLKPTTNVVPPCVY